MIEQLRIRGLGVIDDATIAFDPGLTAITGETGAGKTMVVSGLTLLAGGRADGELVRSGATTAWIDGEWDAASDCEAVARVEEAGAEAEPDGERVRLLLGRTIAAEGRSRAFAGGRSVPIGVLQDAARSLLAIHGQSDQLQLRASDAQRDLVDRFGGAATLNALADYRGVFEQWRDVRDERARRLASRAERDRAAAMLAHGIAEIEAVNPQPGEDVDLDREAARLQHAGSLLDDVQQAHDALVGSEDGDGAVSLMDAVATAGHALDRAVAVDPALAELRQRLADLTAVAADLGVELAQYASGVDADPAHQTWVEDRRSALSALRRRYGASIDEVLAWLDDARAQVADVADDDDRMAELAQREAELSVELAAAAARLTDMRSTAAARLAAGACAELAALAMPDAALEVRVTTEPDPGRWTSSGADRIDISLRPHRGGEFRPVAKSASGGELSRVMLAIEVVLAGADPVPTFVFDEVDAGIGGRAAIEVGRRLARLARSAQVIVVTHLPQVAAFADRHVVVAKGDDGLVTTTSVGPVDGSARTAELVRMLSGLDASEAGVAHAEELLAMAAEERASGSTRGESRVRGTAAR